MTLTPPFATADDLALRWRPLSTAERTRAETLLEDASQLILDEDTRGLFAELTAPTLTLRRIVCNMVERHGLPDEGGAPVTQMSQTMGPFTEQRTYEAPSGDLYLTKAERRQLGFSRQRAGSSAMWDEPA